MKVGNVVVDLAKDLTDLSRIGIVTKVSKRTITIEEVKLVRTGKKREAIKDNFAWLYLVVARLGKKKAGQRGGAKHG